jgi:hypothetical protein
VYHKMNVSFVTYFTVTELEMLVCSEKSDASYNVCVDAALILLTGHVIPSTNVVLG